MTFEGREYPLVDTRTFRRRPFTISSLNPAETIFRVREVALCGSDIAYYKGPLPEGSKDPEKFKTRVIDSDGLVLGHEGTGVVLVSDKFNEGQRIVPVTYIPCGECFFCSLGNEVLCERPKSLPGHVPGLFRTIANWDSNYLIPVPKEVSDSLACLTEPISLALRVIREGKISPRKKVAIIGSGSLGFVLASIISFIAKVPKENLFFIGGRNRQKIEDTATFATGFLQSDDEQIRNLEGKIDIVIEAAGDRASVCTVPQSIRLAKL